MTLQVSAGRNPYWVEKSAGGDVVCIPPGFETCGREEAQFVTWGAYRIWHFRLKNMDFSPLDKPIWIRVSTKGYGPAVHEEEEI